MQFNRLDYNDTKAKFTLPLGIVWVAGKAESDCPRGLVSALLGDEYIDVIDGQVAWYMRGRYLQYCAVVLAAQGKKVLILDGSADTPIDVIGEGNEVVQLRVDGDYAMLASLQNAGMITLFEAVPVFSDPNSNPMGCNECAYCTEPDRVCDQFDLPCPEIGVCLDGVKKDVLNWVKKNPVLVKVQTAQLPPARLKTRIGGSA